MAIVFERDRIALDALAETEQATAAALASKASTAALTAEASARDAADDLLSQEIATKADAQATTDALGLKASSASVTEAISAESDAREAGIGAINLDISTRLNRRIQARGLDVAETDVAGDGTTNDTDGQNDALARVATASAAAGEPCALFQSPGDFLVRRASGTATDTITVPSGVQWLLGRNAHVINDPTTPRSATGQTLVRLGGDTTGVSDAMVWGPGKITGNYEAIRNGDSSSSSIWGVFARMTHATSARAERIRIGGGLELVDFRIPVGTSKTYNATWPTLTATFHDDIDVDGLIIDKATNRAAEFGETTRLRFRNVFVRECANGPQFLMGTNDYLVENVWVYYTDSGMRIAHGAHHGRYRNVLCAPHPNAGPGISGGSVYLGLEPQADTVDTHHHYFSGVVLRDTVTDHKRALRMQASAGAAAPVSARFRKIVFDRTCQIEGDVDLRFKDLTDDLYPDAIAAVTTLEDVELPIGVEGTVYQDTLNVSTGFPSISRAGGLTARKATDEAVAASAVLQADDHCAVRVEANHTYDVELIVKYDGSTTGDLKVGWTAPVGATMDWGGGPTSGLAGATGSSNHRSLAITDTVVLGAEGAGIKDRAVLTGQLVVSSAAGVLAMTWAQNTSDPTATHVFAGSKLTLTPST